MLRFIKELLGDSESKYLEISNERLESLNKAEVTFFANLREDSECFSDLIGKINSPEMLLIIEDRFDKIIDDFILSDFWRCENR